MPNNPHQPPYSLCTTHQKSSINKFNTTPFLFSFEEDRDKAQVNVSWIWRDTGAKGMWLQMYYRNDSPTTSTSHWMAFWNRLSSSLVRLALHALGCFPPCFPLILKPINDHPGLNDIQNQTVLLSNPGFSWIVSPILFPTGWPLLYPPLDYTTLALRVSDRSSCIFLTFSPSSRFILWSLHKYLVRLTVSIQCSEIDVARISLSFLFNTGMVESVLVTRVSNHTFAYWLCVLLSFLVGCACQG